MYQIQLAYTREAIIGDTNCTDKYKWAQWFFVVNISKHVQMSQSLPHLQMNHACGGSILH